MVTYPELVNNCWKRQLIRDIDEGAYAILIERISVQERPMAHQLVGEVIAHQGYDG